MTTSRQVLEVPNWLMPVCFAFYLAVNVMSWTFPFFWDNLLTSRITTYLYLNGWNWGIPPTSMDAGHPPLFYSYLLGAWKIFGRNLVISHLVMLPFLWIMIYQFKQIGARMLTSRKALIAIVVLFCLETTILAQSTMISYDIILLCFYLFGLRYLLDGKRIQVSIAVVVLCLISLRGVALAGALFLTDLLLSEKRSWKSVLAYLPGLGLFVGWNILHLQVSGWMLFSPAEAWNEQREAGGIALWFHNLKAIVRVLLEPGRVTLILLLGLGLLTAMIKKTLYRHQQVIWITLIPLVVLSLLMLPFSNPIGHRYFMVVFALTILAVTSLSQEWKYSWIAWFAIAATSVSGHLWVYPNPISNGWDSSMAHVSYFTIRQEMTDFMEENLIPIDRVAAHFPMNVSEQMEILEGSTTEYLEFESWKEADYALYSNISNDYDTGDLIDLQTHGLLIHRLERGQVFIELYDIKN